MSAGAICDSRIVRKLLGRLINFPTLRDDGTIVFHRVYKRKRATEERSRRRSPILHFFCIGILLKSNCRPLLLQAEGAHLSGVIQGTCSSQMHLQDSPILQHRGLNAGPIYHGIQYTSATHYIHTVLLIQSCLCKYLLCVKAQLQHYTVCYSYSNQTLLENRKKRRNLLITYLVKRASFTGKPMTLRSNAV